MARKKIVDLVITDSATATGTATATATDTVATDAVAATSIESPIATSEVSDVTVQVNTLENVIKEFSALALKVKDIGITLKSFQKEYNKVLKNQKTKSRSSPVNANGVKRKPSGFAKPARLSDELCNFLSLPIGSEEPRMVVTSKLNVYIKENNLQNPENRKLINADETLKKLLNLNEDIPLSYFNLQRSMKHLFLPAVENVSVIVASPSPTPIAV